MFNDILRETWVSQELLQEGEQKGLKKGLEQGIQQELRRQRETILDIVLERFPKIVHLVKKQIEAIEDPTILQHLIVKMSTFQTAEQVQQYLSDVGKNEEK